MNRAFLIAAGRPPDESELEAARKFLAATARQIPWPGRRPGSVLGPTFARCSCRATHSSTWNNRCKTTSSGPTAELSSADRPALLGTLALSHLLDEERRHAIAADSMRSEPNAKAKAKAKAVICLFQHGGPSQMDLFDPKPALTKWHGKPHPGSLEIHFDKQKGNILASPFAFARRGQSGIELSELLPETAGIADEITLVRSMSTESVDHESALRLIHTGKFQGGSTVVGFLGRLRARHREPQPAGLCRALRPGRIAGRRRSELVIRLVAGRLPGNAFPFRRLSGLEPGDNRGRPLRRPRAGQLQLLDEWNRAHLRRQSGNSELEARIANFETAARMQTAVPECLDLAGESEATRRMYGLDKPVDPRIRDAMPAGPAAGRAWRPIRPGLPQRPALGHAQQERGDVEGSLRPNRWSERGPGPRPEATGIARIDDRPLDRRVRPAADLTGGPTAATTTATASRSGLPAAGSSRVTSMARPTSLAMPPSRTK